MIDSRIKYLFSAAAVLLFAGAFVGSAAPLRAGSFRPGDTLVGAAPDSAVVRALEGQLIDPA
ncbi:MAG: hypothetical protein NC322_01205, partial [Alistipes senegalensis]|nr:hypothetical protein [Alistipes senegalensis]